LLNRLRDLPPTVDRVLLVGHNDGIGELAAGLAGRGRRSALGMLREKYPTGALAALVAPIDRWPDLAFGAAELITFVRPRDLLTS
jgi:phosphohistidine phosphatase